MNSKRPNDETDILVCCNCTTLTSFPLCKNQDCVSFHSTDVVINDDRMLIYCGNAGYVVIAQELTVKYFETMNRHFG